MSVIFRPRRKHVATRCRSPRHAPAERAVSVLATSRLLVVVSRLLGQTCASLRARCLRIHGSPRVSLRPQASGTGQMAVVSGSITYRDAVLQHPSLPLAQLAPRPEAKPQLHLVVACRLTTG